MYEHRSSPLLPSHKFYRRLAISVAIGVALIAVALASGMAGYHGFEGMNWTDAFENAAMILSGMGPAAELKTDGGKIFAGCYALFSGLMFITVAGVLLAPIAHRALHRFHLESGKKN